MALPISHNVSILQNTDNFLEFIIKDDSGTVIDITNDTLKFTSKQSFAGPITVATITVVPGGHSDPVNGKTKFKINKEDIDTEVSGSVATEWIYEVRRVEAVTLDEFVHYLGKLTIQPSVT